MSSEHHSNTPRHAKQKCSSLQCTSPYNHIVHAPRTAAAHTRSNKCSSDQCYPRAAVGSKQKRRAAKPQKSVTTGRRPTERSHSNEFSPNALKLPPSPQKLQKIEYKAPSNKFFVQHQKKPQCLMLSSQSVDDAFTWTGTHLLFTNTLNTCNVLFKTQFPYQLRKRQCTIGPYQNLKNSKIPHTKTKVDCTTLPSAAAGRRSWCVPAHHAVLSIGYVHGVSLYSGKSILPCLAHIYLHSTEVLYRNSCTTSLGISAPTEDTSVYLEANPLPLRKILWLCETNQHERHARYHNHEDLRSLIHSEPVSPSMHRKAATSIPLPKDAVINGLERVCDTIGIPHNHNHAPPITQHRIIPWDTVSCNKVEFYQPRFANDASEDVKRTAFDSLYSSLGHYDFELWSDGSSSLAELASGSAAPLYGPTKTNDLPVEVHRAAAGRLACS
ncbi:hypothetical protein ECC02_006826 [Trypanosoma cruzi]|uniref:Uncharacterized protein n=1 Tax=Trypanosoma cruzi TaxID=5693 RepID=A0A7J6Y062_TRYCR|nr:hypothetical protein ECC02_006826 [Trypanosoma cruzi]